LRRGGKAAGARDERLAGPAEGTVNLFALPPPSGGGTRSMITDHLLVLVNDTGIYRPTPAESVNALLTAFEKLRTY